MKESIMKRLLYVFFFISGATALGYELVWFRHLEWIFGSSTLAISSVVAAFMGGLSLGSYYVARKTPEEHLVRLYGWLEGFIGIYGWGSIFLLNISDGIFHGYAGLWEKVPFIFHLLRFFHAFSVLILPTMAMGATLPILTQWYARVPEKVKRELGKLYGLNTIGAAAGTTIAGLWGIYELGTGGMLKVLGSINLIIGVIAWIFDKADTSSGMTEISQQANKSIQKNSLVERDVRDEKNLVFSLHMVLFLSGIAAMMYQLIWTRILNTVTYSTVYSFTTILVSFLIGIGIGSLLFSRWSRTHEPSLQQVFLIQVFIAGTALFAWAGCRWILPEISLWSHIRFPESLEMNMLIIFLSGIIFFLLPTIGMGANFPLITHVIARLHARVSSDVGKSYAFTTWGNIVGALSVPLIFFPMAGVQGTYRIALLISCVAGAVVLIRIRKASFFLGLMLLSLFVFLFSGIPPEVSDAGIYARPEIYMKNLKAFRLLLKEWPIAFYEEGPHANVSIRMLNGEPILRINGKPEASLDRIDQRSQLLAAYIPLLLHTDPEEILAIGLGGGVTPGVFARSPRVKNVEVVEIEPAVVKAIQWFEPWTHNLLKQEKVRWIIEDGRGYLNRIRKKYDIISLHLTPGISSFYTVEFYRLAKERMKKNGLLVQWFHTYQSSFENFLIVLKALDEVFPYYVVFCDGPSFFILASTEKQDLHLKNWDRVAETHPDLMRDFVVYLRFTTVDDLISYYVGNESIWRDVIQKHPDIPLHTDTNPVLAYRIARSFYKKYTEKSVLERVFTYQSIDQIISELEKIGLPEDIIRTRLAHGFLTHYLQNRTMQYMKDYIVPLQPQTPESQCRKDVLMWAFEIGQGRPQLSSEYFRQSTVSCGIENSQNPFLQVIWARSVLTYTDGNLPFPIVSRALDILMQQAFATPAGVLEYVQALLQRNRIEHARRIIEQTTSILKEFPQYKKAVRLLLNIAEGKGEQAGKNFARFLSEYPWNIGLVQTYASLLKNNRKWKSCVQFTARFVEMYPADFMLRRTLLECEVRARTGTSTKRHLKACKVLATNLVEKTLCYKIEKEIAGLRSR